MKRRILSLLIALCLIVGLLPAITVHHAYAEATSATVTLFGAAVTVDTDETTADIPAAYYWVDGEEGAALAAATAADAWNYSFTIVEGVPTVTLKNANYTYTESFLSATFDGELKVVYEGTNNVTVPYSSSASRYFVSYKSTTTNKVGAGKLYIEGAENAVLNVDGGDNNAAMISLSNKANLTLTGGTINMEKTNAGGVYPIIQAYYGKVAIENCDLTVKLNDGVGGKHPAIGVGGSSAGLTIKNSNVTVETNAHTGICVGVFQSNLKGVLYAATFTIEDDSTVKVTNSNASPSDKPYSGVGVYAKQIVMKGGTLEATGTVQAVYTTSATAISLDAYDGYYNIYTAKDGEAANEYATTTYFKVAPTTEAAHTHTYKITKEDDVPANCGVDGSYVKVITCAQCDAEIARTPAINPATGAHTLEEHIAVEPQVGVAGNTAYWSCSVCGKFFSDAEGTHEIKKDSWVLDPLCGHQNTKTEITEVVTTPATCVDPGAKTVTVTCECGEVLSVTEGVEVPATGKHTEETVPGYGATCTKPGLTDGTKCKICGETLLTQEELPIEDHKLDEHIAVEPEAGKAGNTAYWECTVCGKFFSDAEGTQEVEKDSWYLAPLCDHEGTQQTTTEEVTTPATCGDAGKKTVTVTCECGQVVSVTEGVEIPATGDHTTEPIPGYGATCTKSGLTDGEKCTVCKQILLKQEEIPASGHNYDEKGECANGCGDRRPVITTDGGKFRVAMNNLIYIRSYIFYLESADDIDISNWTQVKAAAQQVVGSPYGADDWKTYAKLTNLNMSTLPEEAGVYVLFVTYTDVNGKTVQTSEAIEVMPAVKPEIVTGANNFTVEMNGLTYSKGYIFYLESIDSVDLSSWNAVKKAAMQIAGSPYSATGDWKTYTNLEVLNKSTLPGEAGVYVLFVTYTDAAGAVRQISAAIELEAADTPEIVVDSYGFTVDMNGLEYSRGYIFYLESADGVDLSSWNAVKKAAMQIAGSPYSTTGDWKTYTNPEALNKSTLPGEAGVYVLFVTYTDATGAVRQISAAIEIEAADTPEIVADTDGFTVDMNGLEYTRGYIFYLESAEGVDTADWNAVMKAAKKITGSPYGVSSDWKTYTKLVNLNKSVLPETSGVYVLFVTYVDANGAVQQISAVITK